MKCVICHNDEIEQKKINEEFRVGNDVIYAPVHIPMCNTCGERYYDRKTKRYLEEIENKLRSNAIPLKEIGKVLVLAA